MRVVSLVPSLTDAVTTLGCADTLVGVTDWCVRGAPGHAVRVRGTKSPDLDAVVGLHPDLVLANTEENRPADLEQLRADGLDVFESYPRTVEDAAVLIRDLGRLLDAEAVAEPLARAVEEARQAVTRRASSRERIPTLTLVWRRPWMGLGTGTFADDLLAACGFANVLAGWSDDYPRLEEGLVLGAQVVLLPSEPYAFAPADLPAVAAVAGEAQPRFVDGELLTWHGPRTAEALTYFADLADGVRAGR